MAWVKVGGSGLVVALLPHGAQGASGSPADRVGWRHLLSPPRRGLAGARCWVFRSLADGALPEDSFGSPAGAGVGAGSCQGLP